MNRRVCGLTLDPPTGALQALQFTGTLGDSVSDGSPGSTIHFQGPELANFKSIVGLTNTGVLARLQSGSVNQVVYLYFAIPEEE
jgi:hypothetical protein